MKHTYKEEVEEIEELLCDYDRGIILKAEAIYKLMELTIEYKNKRIDKIIDRKVIKENKLLERGFRKCRD